MQYYTAAVMVEHPRTKDMIRQGVSVKVQAETADEARRKIRKQLAEKPLPPVRSMTLASRNKNHFIIYCAPIAETKPTPRVDMRWRKPPG